MRVADLQQFLRSLVEPLKVSGAKAAIIDDLEASARGLDPFADRPVGEFAAFLARADHFVRPAQPGVWQSFAYSRPVLGNTRSALIVLATAADGAPPFETWFDDVYLREVK